MSPNSDRQVAKYLGWYTAGTSILAMGFGLMVLAGWVFHLQSLKTVLPGQVVVKANAGICFILIGLALWLLRKEHASTRGRLLAGLLAVIGAVVGLLSFFEWLYGWDLGLDQLLITAGPEDAPGSVRPGLMSPIAALGFLLICPALLLLNSKRPRGRWPTQFLASAVAIASMFGILDFVLDPNTTHTHIAPTTALILFLISFGLVCARTEWGLGALMASSSLGGTLTRRLFPAAITIPMVIAWLRWKGQSAGLYSDWGGIALMTVSAGTLLACVTAWTAFVVDRADAERQGAQESVRRLASIIISSNDAIIAKTLDGIVTSWNPGAEKIYGYTAQEMIGRSVTVAIPPDRLDEFRAIMQKVVRGEPVCHYGTVRIRKDRQIIQVSLSVSPLKDEGGKIVGVSTIARDITESKLAEEKLREASLYTRSLIEASLDPLVTISRDGRITDVNQATENSTGIPREQLIGSDFSDYFTEPEKARRGYEEVFARGFVRDYPLAIRHTSGRATEVLYNASLFKNERGEVGGVFATARDVTERKRAEEKLREASLYTRNLIEASLDPLVTISREGKITDVNGATEEVTGLQRDRLIGSDFSNYFTVPEKARRGYEEVFAAGFVQDYPLAIRHTSGRITEVLYNASVFRNAKGEIGGVFAAARDITERKRAEEKLTEASLYTRSLIEASLDPLVTISRDGRITDVNQATENATGIPRKRLIGSDFSNYFTEPEKARRGYEEVFAKGFVRDYPLAIRHTSGRATDVLYNAGLFKNERGEVGGAFAAARDVTERKRAEEEVRKLNRELEERVQRRTAQLNESEQRVRRKLESILSPEGDLGSIELADILDVAAVQSLADDIYKLTNIPMFILDLKATPLVTAGWQEICTKFHRVHPESCKNCQESDMLLSEGVAPGEFKLYKCKNNMWDVVTPIMVGGQKIGNLFSGQFFFSDEPLDYSAFRAQAKQYGFNEEAYLTALESAPRLSREAVNTGMAFFIKFAQVLSQLSYSSIKLARSAEETRRANTELAATVKELEGLTYSVSHDLRAPLRHISGFSKILMEEHHSTLTPEAQHHLQRIEQGTLRMGLLVDDLLNLGRVGRQELRLQVTGLRSVVDSVIADLKSEYEGRQVEWKIADLPFVECDPGLIKQVFQNLLSNAVKFTQPRPQAVIQVGQKEENGKAVVFVHDNGVGFSMKYADKLFGVFQRLHRQEDFEGTGVGLATVQRIIQKHGGRIWAEAELDKGATFYFTLGNSEKTELKAKAVAAGDKA